MKNRWARHEAMLKDCVGRAKKNPRREWAGPSQTALHEGSILGLITTKEPGHAGRLTDILIKEASENTALKEAKRPFHLIITSGGDGTSLEVLTRFYHAPEEVKRDFAILRLPMGTGNDGADAPELDKALNLLIEPSVIRKQRAVRLTAASGKGPFLAFNILSVGIDAFVTHMTNKMKTKLPGDSYKLWVDIASLSYDRLYKVDYIDVRSTDAEGNEVKKFREKLLLLAVGESGRRSYGSHTWILPDERNICAVKQMSILRKLALKGPLKSGKHVNKPEAILWNAHSVELKPQHPILAQMDGETVLLKEEDYPLKIELTEPVIPVLKAVQA